MTESNSSAKTQALIECTVDFIEHEKWLCFTHRGGVLTEDISLLQALAQEAQQHVQSDQQSSQSLEALAPQKVTQEVCQKPDRIVDQSQLSSIGKEVVVTKERTELGKYTPKLYKTTCVFESKQHPVSYSETVIVNVGSTKKQYFESVYYENRLIPRRWIETMTTRIADDAKVEIHTSDVVIPVSEEEYHYMSLEPQQLIAAI